MTKAVPQAVEQLMNWRDFTTLVVFHVVEKPTQGMSGDLAALDPYDNGSTVARMDR